MYKVERLELGQLNTLISLIERTQCHYHEYTFLSNNQLTEYFSNRILNYLGNPDLIAFTIYNGSELKGMINCIKDKFDSEIFGFDCYRITDLLVFGESMDETRIIADRLISNVEINLPSKYRPVYLTFSLNNNLMNVDHLFNAVTASRFHYIHTLLTFKSEKERFEAAEFYPNEKLLIREANHNDVEQVAELAYKSFKFSRFHLDPFLDNSKACELLRTSAKNSILQGFVDIMFVAVINNKIVGYYSAKKRHINEFNRIAGEAVISAVDSDYRGLGIFSKLDAHLLNWFADNSDFAEMGTYLVNYPVHKTWIKKGLGLVRGVHQFSKFIS